MDPIWGMKGSFLFGEFEYSFSPIQSGGLGIQRLDIVNQFLFMDMALIICHGKGKSLEKGCGG